MTEPQEIKDLKLEQKVLINGHPYTYKGVQKISRKNFGKIERIVFQHEQLPDKEYSVNFLNKKLKILSITII